MGRTNTIVRTPRFRERAREVRAQRRSRRRKIVVTLVLVSAVTSGGWALAHSRVFGISRIDITGAPAAVRSQVITASGLHVGQSAIGVNFASVRAHVLALPWVADAHVSHAGPLVIRIVVRVRSAAALVQAAGRRWFVDRSGIEVGAPADPTTIPMVVAPDERSLADAGWSLHSAIASALSLWDRFPSELRSRVRSISPQTSGEIEFVVGTTRVLFGRIASVEEKLRALALVEAQVRSEHHVLRLIDVASPAHPAARIA